MGKRHTVLVVDHEPGLVSLSDAWLAAAYAVRTATSGEAALATVEETDDDG